MHTRISCKIVLLTLVFSLSIFLSSGVAESFPFRSLAVGDAIPDATLLNPTDNSKIHLHDLKGSPAILVFWGGDLAAKKKRAVTALSEIEELLPFLTEKNITVRVINAQGDSEATIAEVTEAAGLSLPVYLDFNHQAYGELGIYIMPSVLLLDKEGVTVAGMGYSKKMTATLKGEVEILLGDKTREQVEAELNPVMVDKSATEKEGNRHLNMAEMLIRKGQPEAAERELLAALESNPKLAEAHVELGCLYFQQGKMVEARHNLDSGLDLNPDSLRGEICAAQVTAHEGEVDLAIEDLQAMLFRNSRSAELHYALATLYEMQENHRLAAQEYRKSYDLLLRSSNLDE